MAASFSSIRVSAIMSSPQAVTAGLRVILASTSACSVARVYTYECALRSCCRPRLRLSPGRRTNDRRWLQFRVIGAVVVGGTALTGGRGSIIGTFLGAVIIGMITGGMVLFGYSQNVGDIATGSLIIIVGSLDQELRRHLRSQVG